MPAHFEWKTTPKKPKPATVHRVLIGLEFGGDDAAITAPEPGRVRLIEVSGASKNAGPAEKGASDRLVATFHGTFHRDPAEKKPTRMTFEILSTGTGLPHEGKVNGFDPECMLGVDAVVMTFVNREFQIWLPFLLDRRSEGDFLELVAVAEVDAGGTPRELTRSAVLNVPIRRTRRVVTTSGNNMEYTGRVIGNAIVQHEDYLIQGGISTGSGPMSINAEIIPVKTRAPFAAGDHHIPFRPYTAGDLMIVLLTELLDDLLPDAAFLRRAVPGTTAANVPTRIAAMQARARSALSAALSDIFVDAGFAGATAPWSDEPAATTLVNAFTSTFQNATGPWSLVNPSSPLSVPFWQFVVAADQGINAVGESGLSTADQPFNQGGRSYLLTMPVPIGSGDKHMEQPAKLRSSFFAERITEDPATGNERVYKTLADFNTTLDAVIAKAAIVVAHEIAHNLGLMHAALISSTGAYPEIDASPIMTIMSSSVDSSTFGVDMKFSNVAKSIWAEAFGVTPNFNDSFLVNKTWTAAEVPTIGWSDRRSRLMKLHHETSMTSVGLLTMFPDVPPFAVAPPGAQRGTH